VSIDVDRGRDRRKLTLTGELAPLAGGAVTSSEKATNGRPDEEVLDFFFPGAYSLYAKTLALTRGKRESFTNRRVKG
jgi:hypothetical protein